METKIDAKLDNSILSYIFIMWLLALLVGRNNSNQINSAHIISFSYKEYQVWKVAKNAMDKKWKVKIEKKINQ